MKAVPSRHRMFVRVLATGAVCVTGAAGTLLAIRGLLSLADARLLTMLIPPRTLSLGQLLWALACGGLTAGVMLVWPSRRAIEWTLLWTLVAHILGLFAGLLIGSLVLAQVSVSAVGLIATLAGLCAGSSTALAWLFTRGARAATRRSPAAPPPA